MIERARTMLSNSEVDIEFWPEASIYPQTLGFGLKKERNAQAADDVVNCK